MYPEAVDSEPAKIASEDHARVSKELSLLGFTAIQARNAIAALSQPSALASSLLGRLPPLQACIEFLILQVPECDLPQRFLPSVSSSNPFVTATHAGTDDLKKRWVEEKAIKECGWPAHVVKDCIAEPTLADDWGKLMFALDCRLIGVDWMVAETLQVQDLGEKIDDDEFEAFGGKRGVNDELIVPLPVAPLSLHVIVHDDRVLPTAMTHPPIYLTSSSVAAYLRLHILAKLIIAFRTGTLQEAGETVLMAMMHIVEEEWAVIQDDGPPNISDVLQHLLPKTNGPPQSDAVGEDMSTSTTSGRKRARASRRDNRTDSQVKAEFEQLTERREYAKMFVTRSKLPAFASRSQFLELLKTHRCVVVVGETGMSFMSSYLMHQA